LVRREDFVEELLEERMRKTTIFAAAGLTVGCLGVSDASALTSISPAGVRMATEAMDSSTLVHCRPYRHWHPWGYGTGCHGGGVSVEVERGHRGGVEIERGHRRGVEERSSIHSRTTTRGERGETSVRGSTSTKTETKSGTSPTSKSGTSTGGGTSHEQGGSSGGMSGSSGGTSGGQPGGQKQ